MNIFIRADASIPIGSGHIMRCLTLAEELRSQGAIVYFICREQIGDLCEHIEGNGFRVVRMKDMDEINVDDEVEFIFNFLQTELLKIDWFIVDHYGLDSSWEMKFKKNGIKIAVIDDLANRSHICDLLLDQNLYLKLDQRYDGLVPMECKQFLGPSYTLLRPEFRQANVQIKNDRTQIKRILIFFGSSDPTNETVKGLQAIKQLALNDIFIDVVVGEINPNKQLVQHLCKGMDHTNYHCQISYMADLMSRADLAIGGGGTTNWERAYLGLPSITIAVAANQIEVLETMNHLGATCYLGWCEHVLEESLTRTINAFIQNTSKLQDMSRAASLTMVDQSGQSITSFIDAIMGKVGSNDY